MKNDNFDLEGIELLADLIHNIASAMMQPKIDYDKLLNQIIAKSKHSKVLDKWVLGNLANMDR